MNENNNIITNILSLSPTAKRITDTSSMMTSAIHISDKNEKQNINKNADTNMLLSIDENQNNNSSQRSKSRIKIKQRKTTYKKQKLKVTSQKITNKKRSSRLNKNKQQHTQQKRRQSSTNRKRNITLTPSSRQQQQEHKLKATKHVKIKPARNRKKTTMIPHQMFDKSKKSRDNSPSIRNIVQQHSISQAKSSTTFASNPQLSQESEAKQYTFPKRDRTTSLMALQALAEKIAIYREKYGDIETRHSSITAPPKSRKK